MSYLVLIRHSLPEIQPGRPASQWQLSDEGWQRCRMLTSRLRSYNLDRIFTSRELKAEQTAQAAADQLGIPWASWPGLEEHHRESIRMLPRAEFQALVAQMLQNPQELVFGEETGAQALQRFSRALERLVHSYPDKNLGAVTHGTVLSLWTAQRFGIPAVSFWKELGLPAYVVIRRDDFWVLEHRENIIGEQA